MLKRLYVDNYRSLVNFELHFSPLTLLTGSNGSGKSSILNIFFALRALLCWLSMDCFSSASQGKRFCLMSQKTMFQFLKFNPG
ncbi:MAG: hypothetical protein FJ083_16385 [Cyanobacteria bacterium K_Offshore_surface_m2_239]|nr:hypothetical protein [Cyanobacteria bacterium K_Offshore_surface_m2_239]